MDDDSFRKILNYFNLSWHGYRKVRKGVKKRIARDMEEHGCRSVGDYLAFLQENPGALKRARELLTVSISRFFRDFHLWEVLGEFVIPKLFLEIDVESRGPVRIWSAGCSCGEEAYSLKILWDRMEKQSSMAFPLEVWGTDTNPEVLERAQMGVYPRSSLRNLSSPALQDYFIQTLEGFSIRDELKRGIHWVRHDFISEDPPRMDFDMIFLRNNLLTYYEPPVRTEALAKILRALRRSGFLVIGSNERIPAEGFPLKRRLESKSIFEKITG